MTGDVTYGGRPNLDVHEEDHTRLHSVYCSSPTNTDKLIYLCMFATTVSRIQMNIPYSSKSDWFTVPVET